MMFTEMFTRVVNLSNPLTLTDYPGEVAWMLAFPGCNYRCMTCHNMAIAFDSHGLEKISLRKAIKQIPKHVHAVVLGGGEPLYNRNIVRIARLLKKKGFKVGLQTNGFESQKLYYIYKYVDFIAMDVKAPISKIDDMVITTHKVGLRHLISYRTIMSIHAIVHLWRDKKYEFRTTVVPQLSKKDLDDIAHFLHECDATSYYLQKFNPIAGYSPETPTPAPVSKEDALDVLRRSKILHVGVRW